MTHKTLEYIVMFSRTSLKYIQYVSVVLLRMPCLRALLHHLVEKPGKICGLSVFLLCSTVSFPSDSTNRELSIPGPTDALFFQYRLLVRDLLDRECNFIPSCSYYGQQAMEKYGPIFGIMMALERWTRCHSTAREQDYYVFMGRKLNDPLKPDEGIVTWDSLLLPF